MDITANTARELLDNLKATSNWDELLLFMNRLRRAPGAFDVIKSTAVEWMEDLCTDSDKMLVKQSFVICVDPFGVIPDPIVSLMCSFNGRIQSLATASRISKRFYDTIMSSQTSVCTDTTLVFHEHNKSQPQKKQTRGWYTQVIPYYKEIRSNMYAIENYTSQPVLDHVLKIQPRPKCIQLIDVNWSEIVALIPQLLAETPEIILKNVIVGETEGPWKTTSLHCTMDYLQTINFDNFPLVQNIYVEVTRESSFDQPPAILSKIRGVTTTGAISHDTRAFLAESPHVLQLMCSPGDTPNYSDAYESIRNLGVFPFSFPNTNNTEILSMIELFPCLDEISIAVSFVPTEDGAKTTDTRFSTRIGESKRIKKVNMTVKSYHDDDSAIQREFEMYLKDSGLFSDLCVFHVASRTRDLWMPTPDFDEMYPQDSEKQCNASAGFSEYRSKEEKKLKQRLLLEKQAMVGRV